MLVSDDYDYVGLCRISFFNILFCFCCCVRASNACYITDVIPNPEYYIIVMFSYIDLIIIFLLGLYGFTEKFTKDKDKGNYLLLFVSTITNTSQYIYLIFPEEPYYYTILCFLQHFMIYRFPRKQQSLLRKSDDYIIISKFVNGSISMSLPDTNDDRDGEYHEDPSNSGSEEYDIFDKSA